MKKILLAVALLLSVTMMNAQPKNAQAAAEEVSKAVAAVQKAEQKASDKGKPVGPDVYIKEAKAYIDAYDYPTKNVVSGTTRQDLQLFLKDQQILSTEQKKGGDGVNYTVDHYSDKDLWYNEQNVLSSYVITKPAMEGDILGAATSAVDKAAAEDTGNKKAKDIAQLYENLHQRYTQDAFANYTAGDFAKAAVGFEAALHTYSNPVINKVDSMSTYYSGIFESMAGNNEKAKGYYQKAIDLGYYSEGNAFSGLSNIYLSEGDTTKGTEILEQGFMKFPQSQSILVGLINLYLNSKQSPDKLFNLLHSAEANEPNNPSLYYVEGNVLKGLGKKDEAVESYHKANAADANYEYGYLGEGMMLYDEAVSISNAAQEELDDTKYNALMGKAEDCLKNAMEPFEKAFSISKNQDVKMAIAEYLRNIYFRFREKSDEYMQKYETYQAMLKDK
jgi:predicted Zn-dependent protease